MENVIMNLRNMTMDEIAESIDIDDVNTEFYHLLTYYHPEMRKYEGELFSNVCNYRKWYVKEQNVKLPRTKKICRDKKEAAMFAFYGIILSLGTDANK